MTIFCVECGAAIYTIHDMSKSRSDICRSCEEAQEREDEAWLNSDECEIEAMIEQSMREDAE